VFQIYRLKIYYKIITVKNIKLYSIWNLGRPNVDFKIEDSYTSIFGELIDLNTVEWNKDYISGFIFPLFRFDRIKISKYFNKDIDVKFSWELSRFYFGIQLAQKYFLSNDHKYYLKFKNIILDWEKKNPFCAGVNWLCTMEVAIRAVNIIIALSLFGNAFINDCKLKKKIILMLVQHAEYIYAFPEISNKGFTNNHTTANFVGLLFISLFLKDYYKSKKWLKKSINELERCIRQQTYSDGVNFEGSIPYHRLVLEMFAYIAIICRANFIDLSKHYYQLLFRMFEYTAAYIDQNGNAPQVGDNDSGRILKFIKSAEHDHSYLLDIGEKIFKYKFRLNNFYLKNPIVNWIPDINKITLEELSLLPRPVHKSISFNNGGAHILKTDKISVFISLFPLGQNGLGGHNHYDVGSFTLSYQGNPIIVDPGTYSYTRDLNLRNEYRAYHSHNTIIINSDWESDFSGDEIWKITGKYNYKITRLNDTGIDIQIRLNDTEKRSRSINIIKNNLFSIYDGYNGNFETVLHFNPSIFLSPKSESEILFNYGRILLGRGCKYIINEYDYSHSYGVKQKAFFLIVNNNFRSEIKFLFSSAI